MSRLGFLKASGLRLLSLQTSRRERRSSRLTWGLAGVVLGLGTVPASGKLPLAQPHLHPNTYPLSLVLWWTPSLRPVIIDALGVSWRLDCSGGRDGTWAAHLENAGSQGSPPKRTPQCPWWPALPRGCDWPFVSSQAWLEQLCSCLCLVCYIAPEVTTVYRVPWQARVWGHASLSRL